MAEEPKQPTQGKPGTQPETAREYERAMARIREGKGTQGDYYTKDQWEWDQQPGGDQRR